MVCHLEGGDHRRALSKIAALDDVLEAFILEHEYCGELDAAVKDDRVWMTCTCGAVLVRALEPVA